MSTTFEQRGATYMDSPLITLKKPWRKRLSESLSPQVKAALITAVVAIVLAVVPFVVCLNENSRLKREDAAKANKIQELEFELTPFRTLAVAQYSRADADTLKKLAETMAALQKDYFDSLATVTSLRTQLESLQAKMAPRSLSPEQQAILQKKLSAFSGQAFTIITYQDDRETLDLSNTLYRVLLSSKWTYVNTHSFLGFFLIAGVEIGVAPSRAKDFEGVANALASALTTQGITASVKMNQGQDKDHPDLIMIRVGKKP